MRAQAFTVSFKPITEVLLPDSIRPERRSRAGPPPSGPPRA
ncbi:MULTISPECIES: hypothetical protein [unclassified Nocardiopsis]|nr:MULTISPECIES: hypothetical protein [unclassified Nocardiopsis]